ncbi:hypothetical protein C461_03212 [Halorubrum aidingense JCM 13560]|uniref:Uncharacterized protein n=1 Tax=Halorubrum aidingense JCM 13560 TaxID=1230454 RepID=M0PGG6_9EURY|nr:hypothetical protein [Halorubrum aidingense]EMA69151.1 hypothetical protein C461_03212 [Halorubrum aidingense JCM 13560]
MSEQGAIDADFDDAEISYEQRVANALEDVRTEPVPGSLAIDLVTRQLLFVRAKVADTLGEYYEQENFDLATYGPHPWLPVDVDDAAYECYYINDLSLDGLDDLADLKDYAFPAGRLAVVGVEQAWAEGGVGDV